MTWGANTVFVGRHGSRWRQIIAGLVIGVIALGVFVVYQQQEITALNRTLDTDTIVLGGTRYWYENMPVGLPNGTSITFHGVTFTYLQPPLTSYSDPLNYTFIGSVRLSNGTLVNLTGRTVRIELTDFPNRQLGQNSGTSITDAIAITFQDGSREVYDEFSVTISQSPLYTTLIYTYQPSTPNSWFTHHTNPQAAVIWNYTNASNSFAFCVSVRS